MKKEPIYDMRNFIIKNKTVTNLLVMSIGVIFTLLAATVYSQNTVVQTVLMSVGTSIIASMLIATLSLFYIFEQEKESAIFQEWGLIAIFRTRSEMNISTEKSFKSMSETYDVIAFGLKSLRDAKGDRFREKVKKGLKMRILTINPHSPFVQQRELDEKRNLGEIKKTIFDLAEWVSELKEIAQNPDNIEIKYYDTMPLDHYCRQDNNLFIGPYLYGKDSQQTISYEFNVYGKGFEYYTSYFEKIWNDQKLTSKIGVRKKPKRVD